MLFASQDCLEHGIDLSLAVLDSFVDGRHDFLFPKPLQFLNERFLLRRQTDPAFGLHQLFHLSQQSTAPTITLHAVCIGLLKSVSATETMQVSHVMKRLCLVGDS